MKQNLSKKFGIFLSFLLVFAQISLVQPFITNGATIENAASISVKDNEGNEVIHVQEVEFQEGETAWDVLEKVADELDYEESEWGKMLLGVNGVVADYNKNGTYWEFYVNNEYATVGLDSYKLKNKDKILLQQSKPEKVADLASISVKDNEGNEVIHVQEVEFQEGETAWDVLEKVADELDYEESEWGKMLLGVNGVVADYNKNGTYWEFYVNNEYATVGLDSYKLKNKDKILLQQSKPENEEKESENDKALEKETSNKLKIKNLSKEDARKVKEDIKLLTNKALKEKLATEYGDEWWVWGLGIAGVKAPSSYYKSIEKTIKETKGDLGPATEIEKVIIALSSQGYDATNIAGYNLIELLENHEGLTANISSAIYALIAFNSGNYQVDSKVENEILQYLLDLELKDGGWNYFGDEISADITGMALIALGNYKNNEQVKKKIDRAVQALSEKQDDNGGFYEQFNGGYTSETASQVIMGLISVGIDPTGKLFTKKDGNLIEYLLQFRTDQGYLHVLADKETGAFPNQQALLALSFVNKYLVKQESDKSDGSTDKNKDKLKVTVSQNKKTPIKANQTVQVKGTKISVKMPKDLPSDAQIKVKVLEKVDSGKLKVAGDIVEIDVIDANGNPITGNFVLTLAIDQALIDEDVSIYYFDEKTKTWKHVGGTINKDGTISAEVSHFSKYGVFLTAESDKKQTSENKNTDENDSENKETVEEVKADETDQDEKSNEKLPDTATNMFNFIAVGLFFALLGTVFLFIQRKKARQV